MCIVQARCIRGEDHLQQRKTLRGQGESQQSAKSGEQDAFREQLHNDALAASAEGGANSDFLFARGRARERQVGHIDAGDENNECYCSEQHEQTQANVRDHAVAQGNHAHVGVPVRGHGPGEHRTDARLEQANLRLGLFEIETLTKPPQRGHEVIRPIQNHVSRIVVQRNPDLRFRRREAEILRHNPEHLAVDAF